MAPKASEKCIHLGAGVMLNPDLFTFVLLNDQEGTSHRHTIARVRPGHYRFAALMSDLALAVRPLTLGGGNDELKARLRPFDFAKQEPGAGFP